MNHQDIKLENYNKLFEFETISRDIDRMSEKDAKEYCKLVVKLYMHQQEVVSKIAKI